MSERIWIRLRKRKPYFTPSQARRNRRKAKPRYAERKQRYELGDGGLSMEKMRAAFEYLTAIGHEE